jgi:GntR family transcriptional regulator, transcriptional repressor for pyruvate dehydrogenase complex
MSTARRVQQNIMSSRKSLPEVVVNLLLERIIGGHYEADAALPTETQISEELSVSRLTVREAIKTLRAGNVVRIARGVGTFVNPPSDWTSIESLIALSVSHVDSLKSAKDLVEVRRIVETGAATLAATNRTSADLVELERSILEMEEAFVSNDVSAFVEADSNFHNLILHSSKNIFIPMLFEPIKKYLLAGKLITSSDRAGALHGIEGHKEILHALKTADPEGARRAMANHMDRVIKDIVNLSSAEADKLKKPISPNA